MTVVAGGRAGALTTTVPLSTWWGLQPSWGYRPGDSWAAGLGLFLGIAALVLLWIAAVSRCLREDWSARSVWWVWAAWCLPFAAGPPLISKDVFAYAAQGLMARSRLDPYASGVSALARLGSHDATSALAAVDPTWRSAPSPYGPLATAVEHLAASVSDGNPLGTVLVLRLFALASVLVIGRFTIELAGRRHGLALCLVLLNPLVLLHLVSGAHLEAPMGALLLGALVAARRGATNLAVVSGCAAGCVKAPAFVVVVLVIAWCLSHDAGWLSRRDLLVRAARQTVLFAVALAAFTSLVPNGLGWTKGLATPGLGYTDLAPGTLVGRLLGLVVPGASFDDAATAGRLTALLAAACVIAYLSGTAMRRSLERNVGYALLVLALASPTIFPWYAIWGLVCIAPTARRRERAGLIAISALASLGAITGAPTAVTTTLDLVAAAAVLVALAMRRRQQIAVAAK